MLVLLSIGLAGCALSHKPADESDSFLAGRERGALRQPISIPLAAPEGPGRRIVQQLTAFWPGRQETLLCVLELDDRHIAMAGMTNEGLSLFNLSYDGRTLQTDNNPLLPNTVAPEYIIADLQLAYWPVASLGKMLPRNWRLETGNNIRRLYARDDLRVEVHYLSTEVNWPKNIELVNHYYNYRLRIQTISYETLSE